MNKELEKIQKRSGEILGDYPAQRAELEKSIAFAAESFNKAKAEQDAVEDLASYDKATESVKRAEMACRFARVALERLDAAPRMDEADYNAAVDTCRTIMERAANAYRAKTTSLMDQLRAVRCEYLQTAMDTNSTLIKLDEAANVLQSKYPCRVTHLQGMPDVLTPSKSAWREYALRYEPYTARELAIRCTDEERAKHPDRPEDIQLAAAWHAVEKGFPRSEL